MKFLSLFLPALFGHFFALNFGGNGGSTSASTTTNNADKRNTVGTGGAGVSGDNNITTVTDGGMVSRALDTVDINNAMLGGGLEMLLDNATKMFNTSQGLIGQTQKSVADAYSTAQTDKAGGIDQKTMIVLAVAAAVAAFAFKRT